MPIQRAKQEIGEVILLNSSIITATTLADIEMILKIVLLLATLGYTLYRWYTHYKKNKKK
jgi:hypothetical protein|tara:strand:- start:173 stop:352 length:180 start_codon:yes stop_codon:yes gene_type:complete